MIQDVKINDRVMRCALMLAQSFYRSQPQETREYHFDITPDANVIDSRAQVFVIVGISRQMPNERGEVFAGVVK